MRKLFLLLLSTLPIVASGQSILSINAQQCVYRNGDDPGWAAPLLPVEIES